MKLLDRLALTILIIGGIHLLLSGVFDINVMELVFGTVESIGAKVVYVLIGISALWCIKYYGYTPEGGSRLQGR